MIATAFCGCTASDEEVIMIEKDIAVAEAGGDEAMVSSAASKIEKDPETEKKPETVTVYVCGAVKEPGVYTIDAGKRIVDAITAAGGPAEDAGCDYLNLASMISDGQKIYIPTNSEIAEVLESGEGFYGAEVNITTNGMMAKNSGGSGLTQEKSLDEGADANGKVDINSADAQTLMTLPGIGQSKADKIIAYRDANGGFTCIEDIMLVGGIKEGLFNKVRDRICVNR